MESREDTIHSKLEMGGGKTSYRVLVIDDDNWNYRIVSRYLMKYQMETIFTDCGFEGIIAALNRKPDLIFLDLVLPDIQGVHVLQLLRKIDITKNIPIIILSANIERSVINLAKQYRVTEFISKPYKETTIVEKLKKIFYDDPIFDML